MTDQPKNSVQQVFSQSRLSLVADVLVTAGWTPSEAGWTAPEKYQEFIARSHGRGEWSMANAIRFMVTIDEAILAMREMELSS